MTAVITMRQLLDAGVHFGHQTRRWNPKMKRFIYGERSGIYIIDLNQTLSRIETAYTYVRDTIAGGGTILFIGTKKQAQDPIQSYAEKCGMPYINERWLGGMLTNFETMAKRVEKMKEYERMKLSGEFEAMPKKEALLLSREL
jgi:small subunit ribosomal protein S2